MTGPALAVPAGDPAELYRLADELDGHADRLACLASDTTRTTSGVRSQASWHGGAADAYSAFTEGVASSAGRMPAPLSRVASAILRYADVLSAAQRQAKDAIASARQVPAEDFAAAMTSLTQRVQQATDLVAGAATEARGVISDAALEISHIWEKGEPVRTWIERLHAGWDVTGADHLLEKVIDRGERAERGLAALEERGSAGFKRLWLSGGLRFGRAFGAGGAAAGLIGDFTTLTHPGDRGVMGVVDRGMAGGNMASPAITLSERLIAANQGLDEIPGFGEAVATGTAAFLGGDYLYHNWQPVHEVVDAGAHGNVVVDLNAFAALNPGILATGALPLDAYEYAYHNWQPVHDVADFVGHTTLSLAKDACHGVQSAASSLFHLIP